MPSLPMTTKAGADSGIRQTRARGLAGQIYGRYSRSVSQLLYFQIYRTVQGMYWGGVLGF